MILKIFTNSISLIVFFTFFASCHKEEMTNTRFTEDKLVPRANSQPTIGFNPNIAIIGQAVIVTLEFGTCGKAQLQEEVPAGSNNWVKRVGPTHASTAIPDILYTFTPGSIGNCSYKFRAVVTGGQGCTDYTGAQEGICLVTVNPSLGDPFGGGKIAYIFQPGDPGYISGEVHGLIAAPGDQSIGTPWGCPETSIVGTSGELGAGPANTLAIINGCGSPGIAARICNDLVIAGYSDWFLPSRSELYKLYQLKNILGGFTSGFYWSSNESYHYSYAWALAFDTGYEYPLYKGNSYFVRAVRSF